VTQAGYALLGLTALTAMLVGVLTFALLRIAAGARDARRHLRDNSADALMMSAALQEAVSKLKAQEQAMSARADASDHLRGQIADSLTAGLLVLIQEDAFRYSTPRGGDSSNWTRNRSACASGMRWRWRRHSSP